MAEITDLTQQYKMPFVWPRLPLDVNRVDAVVIHHTVTFFLRPDATVAEELAHIDMIHLYHKSKGFVGFAYHFIVFPSGRAYLVVLLKQWGTHVAQNNDHLWAVAAAGNFISVLPGQLQRDGVTQCIAACYEYKRRRLPVRPHKAYTLTSCPGRWYEILNELIPEEEDMTMSNDALEAAIKKLRSDATNADNALRASVAKLRSDATGADFDIRVRLDRLEARPSSGGIVRFPGATVQVPPMELPVEEA